MATIYPKGGKGSRWTEMALKALRASPGANLSDGDGLVGTVRTSEADGRAATIRFKYAFKWDGKVTWHYCGTWPLESLRDIRDARDKARGLVKQGINPTDQRKLERVTAQAKVEADLAAAQRARNAQFTFKQLFDAWLDTGVARADGNAELRRSFGKDLMPALGTMKVSEIDDANLTAALRKVGRDRDAPRAAGRLLDDLRQMFSWGSKRQPWRKLMTEGNPADLVQLKQVVPEGYVETPRDRILSREEIVELRTKLLELRRDYAQAAPGQKYGRTRPLKQETELALWLSLSTACRIGELLKARWDDIDFGERIWYVPAANTKSRVAWTVFLSDFAFRHFKRLHVLTGHSEWCFPARPRAARKEDGEPVTGHVYEKAVTRQVGDRQVQFSDRADLPRRVNDNSLVLSEGAEGAWTPHDLRRTAATLMQELGVSLDVIDRCQNHVLDGAKVRRHYMHHDYAREKREAWSRLGALLDELLGSLYEAELQLQARADDDPVGTEAGAANDETFKTGATDARR